MDLMEVAEKFEQDRNALIEQIKGQLTDVMSDVFDKCPDIKRFEWTQYTPYFNDGDECVFNVYDFYVYTEDNEDEDEGIYDYQDKEKKYQPVWDIEKFASTDLGETLFREVFGDHSKVTVTREGITIDGYYHD